MIKNKYNWPLWHWHFEISSKCSLRCPRCPRNELPDTLVTSELDLNFFKTNFTPEVLQNVSKVSFCGDDGDPIYAKDLLGVLDYLKTHNPLMNILIVTNGSYKTPSWWQALGKILNHNDEIHWSVDGYDQYSNNQYRVNSDWNSIVAGMKACKTNALKTWAAIYFKFNEHHIDTIKNLAQENNMDQLQFTLSTKFGSFYNHYNQQNTDTLEPTNKNLISKTGRFQRHLFKFTDKKIDYTHSLNVNIQKYNHTKTLEKDNIIPLCLIGTKGLYINSQGQFIPCCWLGNRYDQKTYDVFMQDQFSVKKHGLEKVLNNNYWEEFFNNLQKNHQCREKCKASNVTLEYATNW